MQKKYFTFLMSFAMSIVKGLILSTKLLVFLLALANQEAQIQCHPALDELNLVIWTMSNGVFNRYGVSETFCSRHAGTILAVLPTRAPGRPGTTGEYNQRAGLHIFNLFYPAIWNEQSGSPLH